MLKRCSLGFALLIALSSPVLADPPADLDACIALSAQVAKAAAAKIKTEAEYARYHLRSLDIDSACGLRDFAGAEKIANDIKATFHLN
jgi:hypothetical protein